MVTCCKQLPSLPPRAFSLLLPGRVPGLGCTHLQQQASANEERNDRSPAQLLALRWGNSEACPALPLGVTWGITPRYCLPHGNLDIINKHLNRDPGSTFGGNASLIFVRPKPSCPGYGKSSLWFRKARRWFLTDALGRMNCICDRTKSQSPGTRLQMSVGGLSHWHGIGKFSLNYVNTNKTSL